jgi:hypothetical protein
MISKGKTTEFSRSGFSDRDLMIAFVPSRFGVINEALTFVLVLGKIDQAHEEVKPRLDELIRYYNPYSVLSSGVGKDLVE